MCVCVYKIVENKDSKQFKEAKIIRKYKSWRIKKSEA